MLSENKGSMALSAPLLEQHYKDVASFQERRAKSARLISHGLLAAGVVIGLSNLGLAWSLATVLPLTKLVPVYFVIRSDGTIDSSPALSTLPKTTNQAIIRAALWQYVQQREGYSYETAQYRYNIISGMSDPATRETYQRYFNYPNPESPQVTVGKNGVINVQMISVALISPNVAQVRYQRSLTLGPTDSVNTTWTATLQFQQINSLPVSQRLENPGGIIITSYQNEQDSTQ